MKHFSSRYARILLALMVAVLLVTAFSGSAAAWGPVYHTVQPGQTLFWIAGHYGVSVWALACANGLWNPNYIWAGMVLTIPYGWYGPCKPHYDGYDHKDGKHGYPHPMPPPKKKDCWYVVKWGDDLFRIALKFGTNYWALAFANHLSNPNYIYAGQVLRIPGCN